VRLECIPVRFTGRTPDTLMTAGQSCPDRRRMSTEIQARRIDLPGGIGIAETTFKVRGCMRKTFGIQPLRLYREFCRALHTYHHKNKSNKLGPCVVKQGRLLNLRCVAEITKQVSQTRSCHEYEIRRHLEHALVSGTRQLTHHQLLWTLV
jgi:hypothetical protein